MTDKALKTRQDIDLSFDLLPLMLFEPSTLFYEFSKYQIMWYKFVLVIVPCAGFVAQLAEWLDLIPDQRDSISDCQN